MKHLFLKTIIFILWVMAFSFTATAASLSTNDSLNTPIKNFHHHPFLDQTLNHTLAISNQTFGWKSPVSVGLNYDKLTGVAVTAKYSGLIKENLAFSLIGEYGSQMYRLNGTIGSKIFPNTFAKLTIERLTQVLPFQFASGNIEKRIGQNAVGVNIHHNLNTVLQNINYSAYYAKASSVSLSPLNFQNCGSLPGASCIDYRHIVGGQLIGFNVGTDVLLSPFTAVETKLYYDHLHYPTWYAESDADEQGIGFSLQLSQLLSKRLKAFGQMEIRKVYDTYSGGISWLPPLAHTNLELSVNIQKLISHNHTPNSHGVGVGMTLDLDPHPLKQYSLNQTTHITNLEEWVKEPAIYMHRVLAIAEEKIVLLAAIIQSVVPNFGPMTGDNIVTLNGSNFSSDSTVYFGNQLAVITSLSRNKMMVIAPASNAPGAVDITINTPNFPAVILPNGYIYVNPLQPHISAITPNSGSINGGALITLSGTHFTGTTTVMMGGTLSNFTVIDDQTINVITPGHTPGLVEVSVTTTNGSTTLSNGFTFQDVPVLNSISPPSGSIAGNTAITLSGANLFGTTSLKLGGAEASNIVVSNGNTVTAASPAHDAGVVDVEITTTAGSVTLPNSYTFLPFPVLNNVTPAIGNIAGTNSVTLTGEHLATTTQVLVDGNPVSFIINGDTSVEITMPAHDPGTVDIVLTTAVGSVTLPNSYTYEGPPTLASIDVSFGSVNGGTVVTLTGSGLKGTTQINFGNALGTNISVNSNGTTATVTTPNHAAGAVDVTLTTPLGSATLANGYLYIGAPILTQAMPVVGKIEGNDIIILSGNNLTTATQVSIDNMAVDFVVNGNGTLSVTTPAHAIGNVEVKVITPAGNALLPGGFTYQGNPTITQVSPVLGSTAGGDTVILTGTNLTGTNSVSFGNAPAIGLMVENNGTTLTLTTPAHAAGLVDLTLSTAVGSTTVNNAFQYVATPTILNLSPTLGPITGGNIVTLTGTNFSGAQAVIFDNLPATNFTVNSDTSITATVPGHGAAVVNMAVTNIAGSGNLLNGYTYVGAPLLNPLTPNNGPLNGGITVTLHGNHLASATEVLFGGVPATALTVIDDNTVTVIAPAHAAGSVDVSITTQGGIATLSNGFSYNLNPTLAGIVPASGLPLGGTLVTLTGAQLTGATAVTFDGLSATDITVVNDTSVTVRTPAHLPGSVDVTITTPNGVVTLTNGFTYQDAPQLISLLPTSGTTEGGTSIVLTGSHLTGTTAVIIGGLPAEFQSNSDTQLTLITPLHAAGPVDITVTTGAGSATLINGYTYTLAPTLNTALPAVGSIDGGTAVVLAGSNLTGATSVTFGGTPAQFTVDSGHQITATAPAHSAGTINIVVSTPQGNATLLNGFSYQENPILSSLLPNSGTVAGGTVVTLQGAHLNSTSAVTFGGKPATQINVIGATTVQAVTPDNIAGSVDVTLTNPINAVTLTNGYTYVNAPILNQVSPVAGPLAGNITVTLTGVHLTGTTEVKFGNNSATNLQIQNDNQLTVTLPAHAAGSVDVVLSTPGGIATRVNGFTYADAPSLVSVLPVSGQTAGGTLIEITGNNLLGTTSVSFGGTTATHLNIVNSTTLHVNAPAHIAGSVDVTVNTSSGTVTLPNSYTYIPAPVVTQVSPSIGTTGGGTMVVLTGQYLTAATSVIFDETPATTLLVNNDNQITVTAPNHNPGVVDIKVTTAFGTTTLTGKYTYANPATLVSVSPLSGSTAGGTLVTLTGTNLTGTSNVKFDNIAATNIQVINDTTVTAITPNHVSGSVNVTLTTPINTATLINGYTYAPAPTLTSLNPTLGSVNGGTSVTLNGTNLTGTTTVLFGGNLATNINVVNSTTITATAPSHAAATVDVSVTNAIGSSSLSNAYTYSAVPNLTSCHYSALTIYACVGTNLNAFVTPYLQVQGGLTCNLAAGLITPLIPTVINLVSLGGVTTPLLYTNCQVRLCANAACTGLQSNTIVFAGLQLLKNKKLSYSPLKHL